MSIKKACILGNSLGNTGKECDIAMGATAMLIAVPPTLVFDLADIADDPIAWIKPLLHGSKATRVYPFFGNKAPINTITNNTESDVSITLDDGTTVFLRYGVYNRLFETIAGGLCYAKALKGLNQSGYNIMEIDQQGQLLIAKNGSGAFRGLITSFMFSPAPILADFKSTPYKNRFQVSYTPSELVENGEIFVGAGALLSLMGLINAEVVAGTTANSVTKIYVGVQTECAEADLVAAFGADLADPTNFIVTNAAGVVQTITAAAVVGGQIELTGTFISASTYFVVGSAPSIWLGNLIEGYDAEDNGVFVTIP